ncbi:DUF924 domain-containing protein [Pasteurellaceae bacterium HPA106]|uniref:DUF924 family protein n=1 Tax=Spirabiliibacterium pneumoniae TaxID=221400 RepID=UPI001AADBA2E|nr:DUF924 family protein [Spirabiliibacterium pneumoniae]MBE2895287.1 DUF924 domain-containing protein [Spirabiliibacterium pneumoniae]
MQVHRDAQTVLDFWFDEKNQAHWFVKSAVFDEQIRTQFADVLMQASACELSEWRTTVEGRLAEIIVLDQFSRNIYRNTPQAFAQDDIALALAQEALKKEGYVALCPVQKKFILMPFMHSESRLIHERALPYFEALQDERTLDYELRHKAIIDQFGRYPHRNAILNRTSTPEEQDFLKQPNSAF